MCGHRSIAAGYRQSLHVLFHLLSPTTSNEDQGGQSDN
jgi:hypothetical protein